MTRAFCSLLSLAAGGRVAVRAEEADHQTFSDFSRETELAPFDIASGIPFSEADTFFGEISRRYLSGKDSGCSFLTGSFSIMIFPDREPRGIGARRTETECFSVKGLQFSRSDILRHFGSGAKPVASEPPPARRPSRGRGKGNGSMGPQDAPLIKEMHEMIQKGLALSAHAAAGGVAERASGNCTWESKRDRLRRRYLKIHGTSERNGGL